MKGLLIYDEERFNRNKWFCSHILDMSKKYDLDIVFIFDKDLYSISLYDINFAIIRVCKPEINLFLEFKGIRTFNSYNVSLIGNDKLNTYNFALKNAINVMRTSDNINDFSYPFIAKHRNGHGGSQVYLINNERDKKILLNNVEKEKYIYQELANNIGYDLRVYVLGNKIIDSVLRVSKKDFRSNYSLGGNIFLKDNLDLNVIRDVKKITRLLNPDFIGIDFIIDKGQYVFNEIEDVVGTRMLYKLRNYDVIDRYLSYIKKVLEN